MDPENSKLPEALLVLSWLGAVAFVIAGVTSVVMHFDVPGGLVTFAAVGVSAFISLRAVAFALACLQDIRHVLVKQAEAASRAKVDAQERDDRSKVHGRP